MNIRNAPFPYTIIIIFSITIFHYNLSGNALAEMSQYHQNGQKPPLTSLKCNEFTFDASKSHIPHGQNISYFWEFGDGTTSVEPVVTHIYHQEGIYTVNLSITDNADFQSSKAVTTQEVRVIIPPKVSLKGMDRSCINEPLKFSTMEVGANKRKKLSYLWNFGDGTLSEGKKEVFKSYKHGGDYKVLLTVDDNSGNACGQLSIEKIVHINEPPLAQSSQSLILRCVTIPEDMTINFDASPTTDVNNDFLTYAWEFGDGSKAEGKEVFHQYQKLGNYDAKLIVSDNTNLQCGTSVAFVAVKFNKAPKANAGKDTVACVGDNIMFDGSKSYIHKKGTEIAQWFFGDGIAKHGLKTTHRYDRPGIYQATLTLENKLNKMCPISRDTRTITVNSPPIVSIKNLPFQCAGKTLFFDASSAIDSDGDSLKYYWNFGDGSTSQIGAKVTHRFNQGGNYRVSVVVDDQKGVSCSTATAQTNVRINTPPIADAGANNVCCVNKRASFSASGSSDPDGDQLTYKWDFGDGTRKQGENVTHVYTREGSYNVTLTVDDQNRKICGKSIDSFVAVVKEGPKPVISTR